MKLADYEFSQNIRKDLSLVDVLNDIYKILNFGRYQMRVVSSVPDWTGEEGEHLLYVSGTTRRWYWYDITNATWQFIQWVTEGFGQATVVGNVQSTGQTGSIGATTIYTPASAGLYRLSFYAVCTTAGSAGTLDVTALWTDNAQAQTSVLISLLDLTVLGAAGSNTIFIRSTAAAIQFSTTVTGAAGSPQYALYIVLEALF